MKPRQLNLFADKKAERKKREEAREIMRRQKPEPEQPKETERKEPPCGVWA